MKYWYYCPSCLRHMDDLDDVGEGEITRVLADAPCHICNDILAAGGVVLGCRCQLPSTNRIVLTELCAGKTLRADLYRLWRGKMIYFPCDQWEAFAKEYTNGVAHHDPNGRVITDSPELGTAIVNDQVEARGYGTALLHEKAATVEYPSEATRPLETGEEHTYSTPAPANARERDDRRAAKAHLN